MVFTLYVKNVSSRKSDDWPIFTVDCSLFILGNRKKHQIQDLSGKSLYNMNTTKWLCFSINTTFVQETTVLFYNTVVLLIYSFRVNITH